MHIIIAARLKQELDTQMEHNKVQKPNKNNNSRNMKLMNLDVMRRK